ncbi:MAG TPA: DNA-binding response regulator [Propionibacteriaceae bacterium]|nr:response regulator transcription factor [Micropruina sp.]HBX81430.1 DNA-binding response regulator [Propionibacteriaceae bacterium]HBY23922.1 DNA-binding response regulator [Propionibacteriaceae bacterium]
MRLVIADDAALLREGLVGLFERLGHTVVGEAASADELVAVVRQCAIGEGLPDIVVTDVRMPPTMTDDGLRAAVALRADYPGLAIMVLSQYVAPEYAIALFDAPEAGGVGYLLKDRVARVADFMRSLAMVAEGGVVIDPDVASVLIRRQRPDALSALSPREREVLELMANGLSNAEIAAQLYLSGAAVAKHVANIFAKLGLGPERDNRRVRAVLAYLTATGGAT